MVLRIIAAAQELNVSRKQGRAESILRQLSPDKQYAVLPMVGNGEPHRLKLLD